VVDKTAIANLFKILRLTLLLLGVILSGTFGYHYLLDWSWIDSLYMTAITVSTVGFTEVHEMDVPGRLLTIVLMLTSIGVFAYVLTTLASLVVETRFSPLLWRRQMNAKIGALENHYLICGYGRTGRAVCANLSRENRPFVVIEQRPDRLEAMREAGHLFVEGDATADECLHRARIEHASGLVAALGNDAENVYLVLSARQMKSNLIIVSWASSVESERKMLRAGANHSLSPYVQGGLRISHLLTSPHALAFLDHVMGGSDNIRLCEFKVLPESHLVGKSLATAGIRRDLGVIIIGIRRANGFLEFNPSADEIFHEQDVVIGIGSPKEIEKLHKFV